MNTAIVWFRQDLRLADNPALHAAVMDCERIVPVFIDEATSNNGLQPASSRASHVFLHHTLITLAQCLRDKGVELVLRRGDPLSCLQALQQETAATHLYWNRRYDPNGIRCDAGIKQQLSSACSVRSFNGSLLSEPWQTLKKDNSPYRVFTAFWKAKQQLGFPELPLPEPAQINGLTQGLCSLNPDELAYLPSVRWDQNMMKHWQAGEAAAQQILSEFLEQWAAEYKTGRNFPAQAATSKLSPHLHFGTLSPKQIWVGAQAALADRPTSDTGINCFLSEVGWREFAYYLLYHFPETLNQPMDQRFQQFNWREPNDYAADLRSWQRGQTGFPIIDAGMRELWTTGWMHNRVRMIVASFLTKNLLIPWQEGERWFRDTLIDADLASNTMGWQWVAGCGADAAPYFRIFNPLLQSEKFDSQGEYIRRWVPELRGLTGKAIHNPMDSGNKPATYPQPITNLKTSRQRALERFEMIKNNTT